MKKKYMPYNKIQINAIFSYVFNIRLLYDTKRYSSFFYYSPTYISASRIIPFTAKYYI